MPLSARAEAITRRTYNRPLDDAGTTFETWDQTVERSQVDHHRRLWADAGGAPDEAELSDLRALGRSRAALVSGRTLWLGGTGYAYQRSASQFNPLPADTRFITSRGVRSFASCTDGDELTVPTHRGCWQNAKVFDAGVRKILRLTIHRGSSRAVVRTSTDHTWILAGDRRVTADRLAPGDRLCLTPSLGFYDWSFDDAATDEQYWWCYGFVFGDGAVSRSGGSETSRVRLCGPKAEYLPRFTGCGFEHSYPPSCEDDPFVYTGRYLKTLPPADADPRLVRAFLNGYLAADAGKKSSGGEQRYVSLSTSDTDAAAFVRRWAPVFGLYILTDRYEETETNYGTRRADFFTFTTGQGLPWVIGEVEPDGEERCWCLTVENDHSFLLSNGVVTGNCSALQVETVYDAVDAAWLLLNGCGVGGHPRAGTLHGFARVIPSFRIIPSARDKDFRGPQENAEVRPAAENGWAWTIVVGDSAQAWAKAFGKLLVGGRGRVDQLVIDLSNVRGPGGRLRGYGWISNGSPPLGTALEAVWRILNRRAGNLLTEDDIGDVFNWVGTILSNRRAAQCMTIDDHNPGVRAFADRKRDYWLCTSCGRPAGQSGRCGGGECGGWSNQHRRQSNNSILFWRKPSRRELADLLHLNLVGGEPGFVNAEAAVRRCPWFRSFNPCFEILLPSHGFCNLASLSLPHFRGDFAMLERATWLIARANYRQTCVDLDDGLLQRRWHQTNEALRLCGVSLTGVVQAEWLTDYHLARLRNAAVAGAYSMADELGMPRPKAVTTIKPEGTRSKISDVAEGMHRPIGRYVFNWINFSTYDPLVGALAHAGYKTLVSPADQANTLVRFPVEFPGCTFDVANGRPVNAEPAVAQLNRYRRLNRHWADHNTSATISFDEGEIPAVVDWLDRHWDDDYIATAFMRRVDPTLTAADLGHPYLPQEVVTEAEYRAATEGLRPVDWDRFHTGLHDLDEAGCANGVCPTR